MMTRSRMFLMISMLVALASGCTYSIEPAGDDVSRNIYIDEPEITGGGQKKTGWAQSGVCSTGNPLKTVTLQAEFPEPDAYTVQFNVTGSTGLFGAPTETRYCRATVSWRVAGNDVVRVISVGNGAAISGAAEAVRVSVVDALPPGIALAGSGDYTVNIQVSRGVRATNPQPPTLMQFDQTPSPTGHAHVQFAVAPAGGFTDVVLDQNVGATQIAVLFGASDFGATAPAIDDNAFQVWQMDPSLTSFSYIYDAGRVLWVPLAPGTPKVRLINFLPAGGANTILASVLLGIDG